MQFIIPNFFCKIDSVSPKTLFWWVVAASILLAAWMQYIQHGWINPDTVLYFQQARLISLGDWAGAVKVFNWPLYGTCIAAVHKISSLGIHQSAQLLNMLFFGIATASFLSIIQLAGGGSRVMLAGTLLLFGGQYMVGDVLEMLMRDEGFWAFYLSSLVFFIRYVQYNKLRDALFWQVFIIIATLFRIEAICFLIGLPIYLLFLKEAAWKERIKRMFKAYSIAIFAIFVISILILLNDDLSIKSFGRLQEVFSLNLYEEFTSKLFTQAQIMSDKVLGGYLEEFAITGLLLTFLYVMIAKTITAAGILGTIFAGFTLKNKGENIEPKAYLVLKTAAIIAFITMALIIVKVFVLSSRYVTGLSWILLILGAFYFASKLESKDKKIALIFSLVVIALVLGFVKNIFPKHQGYNYLQDTVTWLQLYNKQGKNVFYDDSRIRFYAGAPNINGGVDSWLQVTTAINNQQIKQYELLIISHNNKQPDRELFIKKTLPNYKIIKRFYAPKRRKYIVIYEKINS